MIKIDDNYLRDKRNCYKYFIFTKDTLKHAEKYHASLINFLYSNWIRDPQKRYFRDENYQIINYSDRLKNERLRPSCYNINNYIYYQAGIRNEL